jgi:hypothetical protein
MNTTELYRSQAEDCMQRAYADQDGKPLWVTLAQSWLQLAEHAERISNEGTSGPPAKPQETETREDTSA